MTWYKVKENDAYKRITGKFFIVATKHRVAGNIRYFVATPFFRWREWWWQDVNDNTDNTVRLIHEDDRYSIISPLNF